MPSGTPPRRFAPEPVETSMKSSRQNVKNEGAAAQKPVRKFAVEPVETTSKSSKSNTQGTEQTSAAQTQRRFIPEATETTTRSNHKADLAPTKPKSRFLPQPVETSTKSSRRKASPENEPTSPKSKTPQEPDPPARRKFTPQLIDTSKRTRKSTDTGSALLSTDKTDTTPGVTRHSHHNSGQKLVVHHGQPSATDAQPRFVMPFERRRERSGSNNSARTRSFRLPDLETIESSESEHSNPPSLSTSPSSDSSPLTTSDVGLGEMYKHATRIRESVDETFTRYLLELESRRAEQKMQEQALAAFPNSDFHEPVEHYVDEDSESEDVAIDDRPSTWEGHDEEGEMSSFTRRRTTTYGNWEVQEMQRHHEQLEQERKAASTTRRKTTLASPWWNPAGREMAAVAERDPEMGKMLDRARPPMLGSDINFPRSASPEPARFDVTQGSHRLRSQVCYLTEQTEASVGPDGLWGMLGESTSATSAKSTQSQGLWGGYCVDDGEGLSSGPGGLALPSGPTGLLTPFLEPGNPFETSFLASSNSGLPVISPLSSPSPGPTFMMSGMDIVLNDERELDQVMEREFPDTFITQVYNYLSLGYPSLARPFDEELSKISQVPISELQHDDEIARDMPKGYIRLGDDFEGRGDGVDQMLQIDGCARWKALKEYVREWARQEKNMVKPEEEGANWGTGARRGSWAW